MAKESVKRSENFDPNMRYTLHAADRFFATTASSTHVNNLGSTLPME